MKFFEVFKAGTYPQGVFSEDDVQALAKNYDPKFSEAPITLDHEQKGPAYGWVSGLKAEDGSLKASFRNVTDELKEFVQSGKYRKISVEIYKELEGRKPYLKAVSFLGAGIPQVKGMEPVEFKDAESETYIFELEEPEKTKLAEKTDNEDSLVLKAIVKVQNQISDIESRLAHMINQPDKDNTQVVSLQEEVKRLSAQMQRFQDYEASRQKTEQELSQLKEIVTRQDFEQFLDERAAVGRLTPAQREAAMNMFAAIYGSKDNGEPVYLEDIKNFIKTLPKQVEMIEIATKRHFEKQLIEQGEYELVEFANASEDSLAIYKEAKCLAEKENITFKDALLKLYK